MSEPKENRKFYRFLGSPLLIALLVAIAVWYILIPNFHRYLFTIEKEQIRPNGQYMFEFDLDGDGVYEKIFVHNTDYGYSPLVIYHKDGVEQINLEGDFSPDLYSICAKDLNGDGSNEIIALSYTSDSVYITCYNPLVNKQLYIINTPVSAIGRAKHPSIPNFQITDFLDYNGDSIMDFIVRISVGFEKYPRKFFLIDPVKGVIKESPSSGQGVPNVVCQDINKDNKKEYLLQTSAYANYPQNAPYSDSFLYLMVLDQDLNFLFDPVYVGEYSATLSLVPFYSNTLLMHLESHKIDNPSGLKVFDLQTHRFKDSLLDNNLFKTAKLITRGKESEEPIMVYSKGFINFYDLNLKQTARKRTIWKDKDDLTVWFRVNLHQYGSNAILGFNGATKELLITNDLFKTAYSVAADINGLMYLPTVMQIDSDGALIVLVGSDRNLYLSFKPNPKYWLQFATLPIVFIVLWVFFRIIYRWQLKRILFNINEQKRIGNLQLSSVMNQFDSHFSLNVMSSIASLYEFKSKDDADLLLSRYLKHLRNSLLHSDETLISIKDEIDYLMNYLELESTRLSQGLEYRVVLQNETLASVLIPRYIAYTFVENAIKHGIASRPDTKGSIYVEYTGDPDYIRVNIADNGIGREAARSRKSESTGKGLAILQEIIKYHKKYNNISIRYQWDDRYETDGKPMGTSVEIEIKRPNTWKPLK